MTVGLRVRLLPIAPMVGGDQSIQPLVVSVFGRPDDGPVIRVNSEEIPFDELEEVVSQKLHGRLVREVYVEGNTSTHWADVADVIDRIKRLRCVVILLKMQPTREAGCGDPRSTKHSRCRP